MKRFLFLLGLVCSVRAIHAQYTYVIKADSVKITNTCDTAELIIENHTQTVPGFLFNKGKGRTAFRRAAIKINDSLFLIGSDTLKIYTSALNGLSKYNGNIVLGQNAGQAGNPAMLTSNREIPMNGYGTNFIGNNGANTLLGPDVNLTMYGGNVGAGVLATFQTTQGRSVSGNQPYGNFQIALDQGNTNPDGQKNAVLKWGYNINGNGDRLNPNEASFSTNLRSHAQPAAGSEQFEYYLMSTTKNGASNKHWSITTDKNSGFANSSYRLDNIFWFPTGTSELPHHSFGYNGTIIGTGNKPEFYLIDSNRLHGQFRISTNDDGGVNISNETTGPNQRFGISAPVSISTNRFYPLEIPVNNNNNSAIFINGTFTAARAPLAIQINNSSGNYNAFENTNNNNAGADSYVITKSQNGGGKNGFSWIVGESKIWYMQMAQDYKLSIQTSAGYGGYDKNLMTFDPASFNIGINNVTSPTAYLHIAAGTAAAGTAPLKLTAGTILSTPENGAIEFDGTDLYITENSTRFKLNKIAEGQLTTNFGGISLGAFLSVTATLTVAGAQPGDVVNVSTGTVNSASIIVTAYVSTANTVTVRAYNASANPATLVTDTYKVRVIK